MTTEPTAPEPPKRGRGRPRRGTRVEAKLPDDVLRDVDELVGFVGPDRSAVIALLVRIGLQHANPRILGRPMR